MLSKIFFVLSLIWLVILFIRMQFFGEASQKADIYFGTAVIALLPVIISFIVMTSSKKNENMIETAETKDEALTIIARKEKRSTIMWGVLIFVIGALLLLAGDFGQLVGSIIMLIVGFGLLQNIFRSIEIYKEKLRAGELNSSVYKEAMKERKITHPWESDI